VTQEKETTQPEEEKKRKECMEQKMRKGPIVLGMRTSQRKKYITDLEKTRALSHLYRKKKQMGEKIKTRKE